MVQDVFLKICNGLIALSGLLMLFWQFIIIPKAKNAENDNPHGRALKFVGFALLVVGVLKLVS